MQQQNDQSGKASFPTFAKWKKSMGSSFAVRMTLLGLYAYIPLGIIFLWIELKKITDDAKGSSANYFPWLTIAIFFLPFTLMLVAVLDAAYRLAYKKSSAISKVYRSLFGVLILSIVIGWITINGEWFWKKNSTLPITALAAWIIYNLLMCVNVYFTSKVFKKSDLK